MERLIKFAAHNEEFPFNTGDTQLQNCVSYNDGIFSFVTYEQEILFDGVTYPLLPTGYTSKNIVSFYKYKIYLPTERFVYVICIKNPSNKYEFMEFNGSSTSTWSSIAVLDSSVYPHLSTVSLDTTSINFDVKQFTAYVNEVDKRYTMLFIYTNVGVFRYMYVNHSILPNTASTYIETLNNWFLYDSYADSLTTSKKCLSTQDLYLIGVTKNVQSASATIFTSDSILPVIIGQEVFSVVATHDTKYFSCLAVIETVDGQLILGEPIAGKEYIAGTPDLYVLVGNAVSDVPTNTYPGINFGVCFKSGDSTSKKILSLIKTIHYFVYYELKTKEENIRNEFLSSKFKYLTSISITNKQAYYDEATYLNYYFQLSTHTTNLYSPKNGSTYLQKSIWEDTVFGADLNSFLGYSVEINKNKLKLQDLFISNGASISSHSRLNIIDDSLTFFKEYLKLNIKTSTSFYLDVYSSLLINNRNFIIDEKKDIVYFTRFNGYGALNDRVFLLADYLKISQDIKLKRIDNYLNNIIIFGEDGIAVLILGDNFPSTVYANILLKNIKTIPELNRVIKNVVFLFTTTEIYILSENLLTSTFNGFPIPISTQISTSYKKFLDSDYKNVVVDQNSMTIVLLYGTSDSAIKSYGYNILAKTWFEIKLSEYSSEYDDVNINCIDYNNEIDNVFTLTTNEENIRKFSATKIKFGLFNLLNSYRYAEVYNLGYLTQTFYVNPVDFDNVYSIKLIGIMLFVSISSSANVIIQQITNGSKYTLNTYTITSSKEMFKFLVKNIGNSGKSSYYKVSLSFQADDLNFRLYRFVINFVMGTKW